MFAIGDTVRIGSEGRKGKIVDIFRPLGTYLMYKVHMTDTGEIVSAAKHELVKGMSDEEFQFLFDGNMEELNVVDLSTASSSMSVISATVPPPPNPSCDENSTLQSSMSTRVASPPPPVRLNDCDTSRFVSMDQSDISDFISEQENKNTLKKTLCNINQIYCDNSSNPRTNPVIYTRYRLLN